MGIIAVFKLQAFVQFDNDTFVTVGFHIDAEKAPHLDHLGSDPAQLFQHRHDRTLEILRIGQGKQGGRLYGNIYPRGVSPVQAGIAAGTRQTFPSLLFLLQALQNLQIGSDILLGFLFCQSRLAQHIHHAGKTLFAEFLDVFDRLSGVLADNKLTGHLLNVGRNELVEHRATQGTEHTGHPGTALEYRRHILLFSEILADMIGQQLAGRQGWKGIDETEHLDLELFVLHAPVHNLPHPGPFVEHGRFFSGNG